jgi:ABC-type transport system involved in cytochrome c biogenesis permease component
MWLEEVPELATQAVVLVRMAFVVRVSLVVWVIVSMLVIMVMAVRGGVLWVVQLGWLACITGLLCRVGVGVGVGHRELRMAP